MSGLLLAQFLTTKSGVCAIALSVQIWRREQFMANSAQFCSHGRSNGAFSPELTPFPLSRDLHLSQQPRFRE
jgi:hypothetical protein